MTIRYHQNTTGVDWHHLRQQLIDDDFHNGRSPVQYQQSFENSAAIVIVYDDDSIIGAARMLSDGVCNAYIVDVWTHSAYRRQGIAHHMLYLLEQHAPGQHISLWSDSVPQLYDRAGYRRSEAILFEKVSGDWLQSDT